MNIRIAAFGSEETIKELKDFENRWPNLTIIPFTYKNPKDSIELIKQAYTCDVYFFTGPVPYLYARGTLKESNVPFVHVPFDQLMISNAFYLLGVKHQIPIQRISIDIMHKMHVTEIIDDLKIQNDTIYIYHFDEDHRFEISKVVENHIKLWDEGKIDYVLTSIKAVDRELSERKIPCMKMPIPRKNFDQALKEANTLGTLKLTETSKIVVGFVKIKNFERLVEKQGDFLIEKTLLSLHQLLLKYTHEMDFTLYKGNNQFVLFGTKGSLDKLVENNNLYYYVKEIENTLKINVLIGFGLGVSAKQAENNAKVALTRSFREDESSCYLYNESGRFIQMQRSDNKDKKSFLINGLMEDSGVTAETANTFVDFLYLREFQPFTTQDYAEYGNISIRTSARLIKKLNDNGILQVVGEKVIYDKGRPRAMYQLKES